MGETKRNGFRNFVFAEMMILILAIQGNCLVISTTPKPDVPSGSYTVYACEGTALTIACKENESIHIEYANYGRTTPSQYHEKDQCQATLEANKTCSSDISLSKVRDLCSGKSNCSVLANNSVFGDPCVGKLKYLKVIRRCLSGNQSTFRTEELSSRIPLTSQLLQSNYRTEELSSKIPHTSQQILSSYHLQDNTSVPIMQTQTDHGGNMTAPPVDETHGDTDLVTSSRNRETPTPPYNGPFCPAEKKRNVIWTATRPDSIATLPCPNNIDLTKAKRACKSMAEWSRDVDLSECVSKEILALQDKLENLTNNHSLVLVHELMNGLERASTGGDLYGGDLVALAKIMVGAITLTDSNSRMNYSDADRINEVVAKATSMLLQRENIETWTDLPKTNQSSTATRLLWSSESSLAILANSSDEKRDLRRKYYPGIEAWVYVLEQNTSSLSKSYSHDKVDNLSLTDIMPEAGLRRVTVALFDDVAQWLHVNDSAPKYPDLSSSSAENESNSEVTPEIVVNTRVMSISIVSQSEKDAGLKETVRYTLEHKEKKSNDSNSTCVFWKYSKETFEGHWSEEGCRDVTNRSNCSYTVCECDHLTNFAVLMSVSGVQMSVGHAFALSVITYIGCMISIICLALAFITFYWFKGLQCDRNTIHKNLVLCLFISEVIFLLGIVQYQHRELCAVVTGFLHYFFLASFSWMCLEGVQLYVLLIEVFEAEKSRVMWYYLSAYGAPALIVFISALATYGQGNPYAAAAEEGAAAGHFTYCWLSTKGGLIWAFTGPVAVIILMNSVMLGVAIHTMCKHTSSASSLKLKQKSRIDTIGSWVRGAVVLMILLGSTWIFGFLYINNESLFMAYIFTILNSLQGLFIFVFHCLTNEKVRKEYRRCIQRCTWLPEDVRIKYGGLSGSAALSTTPNQSNSSGVPTFFRMLKNRKRNQSLSSSSFQKSSSEKGNVRVVISPPGDGSSSSSTSHKVKRNASSTSETARLTDSMGRPSSDYLYDHDEITEAPSGYCDADITHVDENEFNGPDMVELSTLEESFIITDRPDYRR